MLGPQVADLIAIVVAVLIGVALFFVIRAVVRAGKRKREAAEDRDRVQREILDELRRRGD